MLAPLPGWRCVPRAVIRAFGEEGPVYLAALRAEHGVALFAFLAPGEEASPDEARKTLRAMLHDEGFEEQFAGELPIVALTVAYGDRAHLAETVECAFRGAPAPTVPQGWVEWIVERVSPNRLPQGEQALQPRRDDASPGNSPAGVALLAPSREDRSREENAPLNPTVSAPGPSLTVATPGEHREKAGGWLDWGATLGFTLGTVAAFLAGLAAIFRNGRSF